MVGLSVVRAVTMVRYPAEHGYGIWRCWAFSGYKETVDRGCVGTYLANGCAEALQSQSEVPALIPSDYDREATTRMLSDSERVR